MKEMFMKSLVKPDQFNKASWNKFFFDSPLRLPPYLLHLEVALLVSTKGLPATPTDHLLLQLWSMREEDFSACGSLEDLGIMLCRTPWQMYACVLFAPTTSHDHSWTSHCDGGWAVLFGFSHSGPPLLQVSHGGGAVNGLVRELVS